MLERSVSVIIPTWRRHEEVVRAVKSALNQTLPPFEVIVVNDGVDSKKRDLLSEINDEKIRYVEAPRKGLASATRNFGVQRAKGSWIALLDDDDIWLPSKLEDQFLALEKSGRNEALISGIERTILPKGGFKLRPRVVRPDPIVVEEMLFIPGGGPHTSTLLAPKWAFNEFSFNEELRLHEDWEWLLNAGKKLPIVFTSDVVAERRMEPGERLTAPGDFEYSWSWYLRNKESMNNATRGRFVCTILSARAAHDRNISGLKRIFLEFLAVRSFNTENLLRLLAPWLVPSFLRERILGLLYRCKSLLNF